MTEDIIIRRLAVIKHLYKLGIEQATLPETLSYTSILSLHDAIDMFMNLAAEMKGISKGMYLIQYFDAIPDLTLKSSVNKINKRRNNLKHDGIIPGKIEIQDTCSVAKIFFEENVKIIFNKEFIDISLFTLISYDKVREFLQQGNALIDANDFKSAARELAKAYFHLLLVEESLNKKKNKNPWYDSEMQPLIKDGKFYTKAFEKIFEDQDEIFKEPKTDKGYVEISEGVASLTYNFNKAFSYTFQSLRIFFLGLDHRKYNHFTSFMPQAVSYNSEKDEYQIFVPLNYPNELTKDNLTFAIDFIMEFALKLQEFRY
jgi:hypothetical protein